MKTTYTSVSPYIPSPRHLGISPSKVVSLGVVLDGLCPVGYRSVTSTRSGTAIIENLTTGQEVRKDLSTGYSLCEYSTGWIVEDFERGDSLVSFADFGTVTFTDAVATTNFGTIGPSGVTILEIQQDTVLTSVSVGSPDVRVIHA